MSLPSARDLPGTALAELMGHLSTVSRGLEISCAGLQSQLSDAMRPSAGLTSSAYEQIQELDRITQTLGDLSALFGALEASGLDGLPDIDAALSQVKLSSVRDQLQHGSCAKTYEIELF